MAKDNGWSDFWSRWGDAYKNLWNDGYDFGDVLKSIATTYQFAPSYILNSLGIPTVGGPSNISDSLNSSQSVLDKMSSNANDLNKEMIDYQAAINQASADRAMQWEAEQAQIERDWQTESRQNYYVDMMNGMDKAGLNPALMLGSGMGVSSMSGATASGSAATVQAPEAMNNIQALSQVATTAFSFALLWKVFKQLRVIHY